MTYSAIGDFEKCSERKYVATLQDDIIHLSSRRPYLQGKRKNNAPYQAN